MSEALREEQGSHEVPGEEEGSDERDGGLHAHSLSTPFTIRAVEDDEYEQQV
jgi:hypothetical protein